MPRFLPRFPGSEIEVSVCGTHRNLDFVETMFRETLRQNTLWHALQL